MDKLAKQTFYFGFVILWVILSSCTTKAILEGRVGARSSDSKEIQGSGSGDSASIGTSKCSLEESRICGLATWEDIPAGPLVRFEKDPNSTCGEIEVNPESGDLIVGINKPLEECVIKVVSYLNDSEYQYAIFSVSVWSEESEPNWLELTNLEISEILPIIELETSKCSPSATEKTKYDCDVKIRFMEDVFPSEGIVSIESLPECQWLQIENQNPSIVSGVPENQSVGSCKYLFKLQVGEYSKSAEFLIEVKNSAPTLEVGVGKKLYLNAVETVVYRDNDVSSDEEGRLTYSLGEPSSGASCLNNGAISISSLGEVKFKPSTGFLGICSFEVVADDGNLGGVTSKEVSITVDQIINSFLGGDEYERFGHKVQSYGDFNGDGIDDYVVSRIFYNISRAEGPFYGRVSIVSGFDGTFLQNFDPQDDSGTFGFSMIVVPDLNSDGKPDIIVGAPDFNGGLGLEQGRVYAFSASDGSLIWTFESSRAGSNVGLSLGKIQDIDGDMINDIVIGIPEFDIGQKGAITVVSGGDGSALYSVVGQKTADGIGAIITMISDLNADGIDEIATHAWDYIGGFPEKRVDLYSGSDGSFINSFSEVTDNTEYGKSIANPGDINGDGFSDILIGSSGFDSAVGKVGKLYMYSGQNYELLYSITGDRVGMNLGQILYAGFDFNSDGTNDFVASKQKNTTLNLNVGEFTIYSGIDGSELFSAQGAAADEYLGGIEFGSFGDANEDGIDDLWVSSMGIFGGKSFGGFSIYPGFK